MNEIILKEENGQVLASSREVAEKFGKQHGSILKTIYGETRKGKHVNGLVDDILACGNPLTKYFIESEYENRGKAYKECLMTRDGFSLVVMGFTGKEAITWKLKYIEAFNKMEQQLKNPFLNISKELQAILMVDKKQQEQEKRISDIENKMTVNYELASNLQNAIKSRAIEILGGKDAEAYKKLSKKLFAAFYRDIKRTFKVNSYKNLSIKNYDLAMKFIENWEVKDEVLKYAIEGLNSQLAFA